MNSPRTACVFLALLATLAVSGRANETVDSKGLYSVAFPGPIKSDRQVLDTALGKVTMHQCFTDQGTKTFMIIFTDYPAGGVARAGGAASVYRNAALGAAKSVNGSIRSQTDCKLGDIAGMDIVVDAPDIKQVARARYFIVGDRFYQEIYVGPVDSETGRDTLAFLDSFRLLH